MKLCEGLNDHTYLIKEVYLEDPLKQRLEMIGVYKDAEIKIWNKKRNGTMIIKVSGSRWAIDSCISDRIELTEVLTYEPYNI